MANLVLALVIFCLVILTPLLLSVSVGLSGRITRIHEWTWKRSFSIALIFLGLQIGFLLALYGVSQVAKQPRNFLLNVEIGLALILLVIMTKSTQAKWYRVTTAWIITLVMYGAFSFGTAWLVKSNIVEAFLIPTNSMAPTVVGEHITAPCPRCGSDAYSSSETFDLGHNAKTLMICSKELRSCLVEHPPKDTSSGDRIIVNKLLRPKRWDIITHRFPEEPDINYLKRIVGLPGETVTIREGAVWIDGVRQTPPELLEKLNYVTEIEGSPFLKPMWGDERRPAKLGPDEYFVLGDFSERARDSRLWQANDSGHPPYAVPESYIIGVATHIYWPPSRWRSFQ